MIPFVFSFTTTPLGFIQNVRTRSWYFFERYTILDSYNESVNSENVSAFNSTRTPISTRSLFVSMPKFEHTDSIHLLPERPVEMIHCADVYVSSPQTTSYPSSILFTISMCLKKWNSALSFKSLYKFSSTT